MSDFFDLVKEAAFVRPGDTLVLRVRQQLTLRQYDALREHWEAVAPEGLKAVFVDAEEMLVYRPEASAPADQNFQVKHLGVVDWEFAPSEEIAKQVASGEATPTVEGYGRG